MNEDNFAVRLAQLRTQRGCSARDMSLSLGQSESYINKIENKRTFPSIPAFFYICEFLGITPQDFFEEGNRYPECLRGLMEDLKMLDDRALESVSRVVKELVRKK